MQNHDWNLPITLLKSINQHLDITDISKNKINEIIKILEKMKNNEFKLRKNDLKNLNDFRNKILDYHNEIYEINMENLPNKNNLISEKIEKFNTYVKMYIEQNIVIDFNKLNIDFEYIKKLEKERLELEKKLKELEGLEELEENKESLLESERLKKDQLIKELEFKNKQLQEQLEKQNELEKINRAIDKLQVPCDELQKSQDKFRENRDNFDKYAMDMFKVATVIFVFMTFYLSLFTEINDVSKSVSIGYYLSHSFPILFPTIIGFLFIRQSNVNSKELDKINRRFILIHEIGQSLRALTEINDEKQMNEKTQRIIDKLIENILNYASENNGLMKNEESNILELNERLDKLIDTIDKKLTVIGKPE